MAQLVKNPPAMWRLGFDPWVGKIPWRRERLPIPVFWPGEFAMSHKESDRTECLSLSFLPVKTFLFVSQYVRDGTSLVAQRVKNLPAM